MTRAMVLLLLLAAAAPANDRVFVETETPRDTYYVHERIPVLLRLGVARSTVIQLFPRTLDLPVQVLADWLESGSGDGLTFALNDDVVKGLRVLDREIDDQVYTVVEVNGTIVRVEPGELVLDAPRVRYAWATKFVDDFIGGRRPVDRRDGSLRGAPLRITVRALPEEGRPEGFTGAVGRFTARYAKHTAPSRTRPSLSVWFEITGDGDLAGFDPPSLAGAHVLGVLDHGVGVNERYAQRRLLQYDLAPSADGEVVPAFAFWYFDPERETYDVSRTDELDLRELERMRTRELPDTGSSRWFWAWALLPLPIVALLCVPHLLTRWRRRKSAALARFRERADEDLADAYAEFLATGLGTTKAAIVSPDLADRLIALGFDPELARDAAHALHALVDARYGGAPAPDRAHVTKLVERMS